jgi:hypothetical protein
MKKLKSAKFCFCTIASSGYIKYALGLFENLQEFYPGSELMICCLDKKTSDFFESLDISILKTVSPEKVWGEKFWKNICCRMQINERAFATKPAMMKWILENGYDYTMFLDSDIILLDKIDDIMEKVISSKMVLIPSYIAPENWRKTQNGIICAGFISFSKDSIHLLAVWKKLCFERCINSPIEHMFYEQKYLDPLVSQPEVVIISDEGVNVSGTDFKRLNVIEKNNKWFVGDNIPLRVFHASSSTDPSLKLMQLKEQCDAKAYQKYHPSNDNSKENFPTSNRKPKTKIISCIANFFKIFTMLEWFFSIQIRFYAFLQILNRLFSLRDFNLKVRFMENFNTKKQLLKELEKELE